MTRRGGFVRAVAQAQRETERRKRQQALNSIKAQSQAAKIAEQTKKAYERASATEQKERARLYTESRLAHVNLQNEELEQVLTRLNSSAYRRPCGAAFPGCTNTQVAASQSCLHARSTCYSGATACAIPLSTTRTNRSPKAASWRQRKVCTGDCKSTGNL